jgi:hypothetical protein
MSRLTLATFAVMLMMSVAATAGMAGNDSDARLDAVATEVAGAPVAVWCETHWSSWILTGVDLFGEDWSFLRGFTIIGRPTVYISPADCETLHALLDGESVGTYHAAIAIHVLAHEAMHQRGITNEGEADCAALPLVPELAVRHFGIPTTVPAARTVSVSRVVSRLVNGKRVRITVRTGRIVQVQVKNPYLERLATDALRWHRSAPPEYQGNC